MTPRRASWLGRAALYGAAILLSLWVLVPIYFITLAAFSTEDAVYRYPKSLLPRDLSGETMRFFLNADGVVDSLQRSVYVAGLTLLFGLGVGTPAGYAIARFVFRGADSFRLAVVSTRAFPIVILSIPLAVTYIRWGIDDSVLGVALAHTALALPFAVLVTSSVFAGISVELEEAAMTLGCSRLGAFRRVALPLALPGLAAAAIFVFIISWNEVFAASILTLRNPTLPAQVLSVLNGAPLPFRWAGGFFMLAPSLIVIFFIRRYLFGMWGRVVR
jgi:multiple sugar transport system permease protein